MKNRTIVIAFAIAATVLVSATVRAEDGTTNAVAPTREQMREQWQKLTPEEREAKIKEMREKRGLPPVNAEMQKRREEWQKLTPEERRVKMQELRNQRTNAPAQNQVREERRVAFQKQLAELRAKKADGSITPPETARLEQLERAEKFMQERPAPAQPAPAPAAQPEAGKN